MLFFSLNGDPLDFERDMKGFSTEADCKIAANIRAGQLSASEESRIIVPVCVRLAAKNVVYPSDS